VEEHGRHLAVFNTAVEAANALIDPANSAFEQWTTTLNAYPSTQRPQTVVSYHQSLQALLNAIGQVIGITTPSQVAARLQAMDAAIALRDQRFSAIPDTLPARQDGQAVNSAFDALAAAARTAAEARAPEATARQAMDASIAEQDRRQGILDTREGAVSATMSTDDPSQTLRLRGFVQFVTAQGIEPFTDYAREHWPAEPEEFYAEAFALFRSDPTFMQTHYPALFRWFRDNHHR
jgi:hypothetical protein